MRCASGAQSCAAGGGEAGRAAAAAAARTEVRTAMRRRLPVLQAATAVPGPLGCQARPVALRKCRVVAQAGADLHQGAPEEVLTLPRRTRARGGRRDPDSPGAQAQ